MQMGLSESPVCGILPIGLAISIMGHRSLFLQHIHFISNVVLSITVLYFTSWLELYSYVSNIDKSHTIAVLEQFRICICII